MATLKKQIKLKIESDYEPYTIIVESSIDTITQSRCYTETSPETDVITQLLVYASDHGWNISSDMANDELRSQLEKHLTDDELLEVANLDELNTKLDDIARQLAGLAPHGIDDIIIQKSGDTYDLNVTDEDIRNIFLSLI